MRLQEVIGILVSVTASISFAKDAPWKDECYLVKNASIAATAGTPVSGIERAQLGHEIVSGLKTVVLVRRFQDNDRSVDSARFSKLTLQFEERLIDQIRTGTSIRPDNSSYTEGGVGFVHQNAFETASNPVGSITISLKAQHLQLSVDAEFPVKNAGSGETKKAKINLRCALSKAEVGDLTPWQGRPNGGWSALSPKSTLVPPN